MRASRWLLIAVAGVWACRPQASNEPLTPVELTWLASLSPLPALPPSRGNPVADDERAALLGQRLFFDPGDGEISCATCHQPQRYFTDGRARGHGRGALDRHTPTVMTAPWFPFLGWDGAADSLWAQSLRPYEQRREMNLRRADVVRLVVTRHRAVYETVFGPLPHDRGVPSPQDIDAVFANVGRALEAYQRRLAPRPAPFDHFVAAVLAGDPAGGGHLTPQARQGLRLFLGEGQCVSCHHGPLLTDRQFHNLGLSPAVPEDPGALGRAAGARAAQQSPFRCGGPHDHVVVASGCDSLRFLNPSFPDFVGAFKTPSLRNVAVTPPYMHGGQLATLADVVAFYRSRPAQPQVGRRAFLLRKIPRSLPVTPLVAFLESLTGPLPEPRWLSPPDGAVAVDPELAGARPPP